MLIYFLRRVALTIPTFIALMFLTFVAIRLVPGDPVEVRVGEHGMSAERLAYFRHELGLDQPFWKQFLDYAWRLAHGDFGVSLATQQKVLTEFLTLFPATLELSFFAMLFAIGVGVPAGAVAAVRRGGFFDQALMTISLFGYSMPIFWWGLLLIMFVGVTLGWTPVSGRIDLIKYYFDQPTGFMVIDAALSDQPGAVVDALRHLILPAIVLGTVPLGVIGLHALRNALLPVVTVIGLSISGLMAGAVLTETIFSWPGVGKWLIESIGRRDYPALQGGVLLVSAAVITVNLIVDLLYGAINPRIRHGR
jgi:dipeptide transport system permease protein